MYNLLYIPAAVFFLLPLVAAIVRSAKDNAAARERERAKAAAAERLRRQAEEQKREAERKRAEREREQERRRVERERRQAEKLEAARQLAEYNERAAAAARELRELKKAERAESISPAPATAPAPVQPTESPAPAACSPEEFLEQIARPAQTFQGKSVSFTGRIPGMTRTQAIQAVQDRGGKAFEKMPAQTNLLVVGEKPGVRKLDLADERISQVKKITAAQFLTMLAA